MVTQVGQRFTVRDENATLATGVVVDILPNMTMEEKKAFKRGRTRKQREQFEKDYELLIEKFHETNKV